MEKIRVMNAQTKEFIRKHLLDDVAALALSAKKEPDVDVAWAIRQLKERQAIRYKIPSWYDNPDVVFPVHLSIEQSSSELTATFKSTLLQGNTFVDLTGGFGVDCAFLSKNFKQCFYIERNADLCCIAEENFKALHLPHVQVIQADSVNYMRSMNPVDCIFIDPARRDAKGKKTVVLSDCEPDVTKLLSLLLEKADTVLIKTSPMLDISLALSELINVASVYVVAVENECKELLFLLRKNYIQETVFFAVNLHKDKPAEIFPFTKEEEKNAVCFYPKKPEKYLYEPNVSLLKAGAYKIVAEKLQLKKLHPNSHLYTSETLYKDFPGRIFSVESCFTLNKNEVKEQLKGLKKANITVRNFPATVENLRKKLKLADGGDIYLFATTLCNEEKVLLKCIKNALPQ